MHAGLKLGAYAAALLVTFAVSARVGSAVGPWGPSEPEAGGHADGAHAHGGADHDQPAPGGAHHDGVDHAPAGLAATAAGYTLDLPLATVEPGRAVPVEVRVLDDRGRPVTAFDVTHDERMHLIAVRRDTTGFQHVHPVMAADGTWRTELDLTPGQWRVFTDVSPTGGAPVTLGADLAVPGDYRPALPQADSTTARLDDGYEVRLSGAPVAGRGSTLTATVLRDGRPVEDLQPHLGAYGHLVVLRVDDLAYLHVHPESAGTDAGPDIRFSATVPATGRYRAFLDFRHDGRVRTADFTLTVSTP